jgi:hypothetical protein
VVCQLTPDKYLVLPLPDAEKTYRMRMFVALKPKRTATAMDEVIMSDLEDVIVHGALQHLLALPQVNWSDRELSSYHAKQFTFQLAERRARANLGNARGPLMARMQPSEYEMALKITNNAFATIPSAVTSIATSLTVTTGQGARFPTLGGSDYFYATLIDVTGNYEIVKVTARTDDVMTLVRGQEGTLAIPFPANSRIELRVTAENISILNQDVLLL